MSITPDTTLMSAPRATLAQLVSALLLQDHGGYSEDDIRFIARLYYGTCVPVGIDPLLVISQMRLETANLSSSWSQPPHYNPAGIGVTGQPGAGVNFPNWPYAARAHVGRLLAYAIKAGKENDLQKLVVTEALHWRPLPPNKRGTAPNLKGLAAAWAADTAYAKKISSIANGIVGV